MSAGAADRPRPTCTVPILAVTAKITVTNAGDQRLFAHGDAMTWRPS
jgi:hypothetical protein